jgi:hypothetical protein
MTKIQFYKTKIPRSKTPNLTLQQIPTVTTAERKTDRQFVPDTGGITLQN